MPDFGGQASGQLGDYPQKPLRRAYERDPLAVERWRMEEYPKLRKRAKQRGAMIFFLDEAGFQSDPPLGRTYGLKGTRRWSKVPASARASMSSARSTPVAPSGRHLHRQARLGSLRRLSAQLHERPSQQGLPSRRWSSGHKARIVKEYVAGTQGRLELHFLRLRAGFEPR